LRIPETRELVRVEGGPSKFSLAVAQRYHDLGEKVIYGATVEEIMVEDDRAVGVWLTNDSELRADIVVSAADCYSNIFNMLSRRYVDQQIRDRHANWPMFPVLLIISFSVARQFLSESPSRILWLWSPITRGLGRHFVHVTIAQNAMLHHDVASRRKRLGIARRYPAFVCQF